MTDEEKIRRLREAGADLHHTLHAIYGWWDRGENVLDVNRIHAEFGLEQWQALIAHIDGGETVPTGAGGTDV